MLSLEQRTRNKKEILTILTQHNGTPGSLLEFLQNSDFFTAPASTKYHEAYEGGLAEHSLKVYENLCHLNYQYLLGYSDSTIAKVGLLHDVCKIGVYVRRMRNVKLEDGRWVRTEGWEFQDEFPFGHGEKSVALLLRHGVILSEAEMLAIRWHMGAFDDSFGGFAGSKSLSASMSKYPLVTALHIADLMSVWLVGASGEEGCETYG